jgi:lysophospholipase L1-like esterase
MAQIREDQRRVLDMTKHIASKIIILHSGDIGQAPMLIWPFTWIYTWRSLKVRQMYMESQDDRVSYVDIYTLNKGRDLSQGYAKDNLHLNKEGYALWYSYIKNQLLKKSWLPAGQSMIRYVALGDSYTIGTGATPQESWPAQITSRLKAKGVAIELTSNLGRNGWTTQNLIDYQIPVLKELHADFVSVLIGTNDWVHGEDAQTFEDNIHKIFGELLTIVPDSKNIIVVTVPDFSVMPVGIRFSGGRDIAGGLAGFNQIIKDQAHSFGLRVVDIYPLSRTLASLVSPDGLHPSAQGYARWADLIEAYFPQK